MASPNSFNAQQNQKYSDHDAYRANNWGSSSSHGAGGWPSNNSNYGQPSNSYGSWKTGNPKKDFFKGGAGNQQKKGYSSASNNPQGQDRRNRDTDSRKKTATPARNVVKAKEETRGASAAPAAAGQPPKGMRVITFENKGKDVRNLFKKLTITVPEDDPVFGNKK